jgi:electron transport complex protein RnfG
MKRIRSLLCLAVVTVAALARADQVYLREVDAPHAIFPDSTSYERKVFGLSELERAELDKILGKKTEAPSYPYLDVRSGSASVGIVFLLDVIGQSKPIDFAIGVTPEGVLKDLEVLTYREPRGEEIHEARFRRQFVGKRLQDPISLGRDIDIISGATISCRSATYAARKALALSEVLHRRGANGTR